MSIGISATSVANHWLDALTTGTSYASTGTIYVALHTGDPGVDGTQNKSLTWSTRKPVAYTAGNAGSTTLTGTTQSWTMAGTETIVALSHWDAATAGNFLWSSLLAIPQTVNVNDIFSLVNDGLTVQQLAG